MTDVVIIGAGPAGLTLASELALNGVRDITVLDRHDESGGVPRHSHHPGYGLRDLHRSCLLYTSVTFLQHCADRDVPVFVHPWDMSTSPRLDRWMSQWLVGMPAETHLSVLSLILGGAFDRLPESLRIAFAHGGGSFAFWLGRADNAWHQRNDIVRGRSQGPPSSYVGRFSVDSVVFAEPSLRLLVDALGTENVMMGSDYPYPLGERPAGDVVRRAAMPEADREAILGGNAMRFLGR